TDAATVTDLERQNENDVAMVIAPARHNDNDFDHSAYEESPRRGNNAGPYRYHT
ncbi:hypothetical protein A2U01_0055081, partial [Trifolium medium]|nr:hypothetical protein [Trifolium medium]